MQLLARFSIAIALFLPAVDVATGDTNVSDNRLTVAILQFQNLSQEADASHWQYSASELLRYDLRQVKSLRLLPEESIGFAFSELKLKPGTALASEDVQRLGQAIEARRVVWGSYDGEAQSWKLSLRLMNVGTGQISGNLTATSSNWLEVVSAVADQVLVELGATETPEERQRRKRPPIASPKASSCLAARMPTARRASLSRQRRKA